MAMLASTQTRWAIAMACAVVPATGCKPTEFNQVYAPNQSRHVDPSWLAAAKHCWPAIEHEGYSNTVIEHQLADPLHFRATFAAYAAYSDTGLINLISHPVADAPAAEPGDFAKAQTPVLTRKQAINGGATGTQLAANGNVPPDAFCIVQAGMPVGFR
jgi:hypothetical protein